MTGPAARLLLALRLAGTEIVGGRRFSAGFAFSLSLGLIGFLALDAAKASLAEQMQGRAQSVLGADLAVSAARPLTGSEQAVLRAVLPRGATTRRELSLMSMVASTKAGDVSTRLVELRAVDAGFPDYPGIELQLGGRVTPAITAALIGKDAVWAAPELLVQLGAARGDSLRIGTRDFTVVDVVRNDPSVASFGLAMAPRVYLSLESLAGTGLVAKGSRVSHATLIRLPAGSRSRAAAQIVAERLATALPSSDVRVRTAEAASEELSRVLTYLNDYLGLVALVALFLAGVGSAYLFRSFLARRQRDIAILLSIGGTPGLARLVYFLQLLLLGLGASLLAIAVVRLGLPALPALFGDLLPADAALNLPLRSALTVVGLGILSGLVFCLPLLAQLGRVSPAALFQEDAAPALAFDRRQALLWLPALGIYWALAVHQSQSVKSGSVFVAIMLGAGVVTAAVGAGLLASLAARHGRRDVGGAGINGGGLAWRLAVLNLTRHRGASLACFLALGLGTLLLNLIPQLRRTVEAELRPAADAAAEALPSLFLFDIQEEQVEPLRAFAAGARVDLVHVSPLIRARLTSVNGAPPASKRPVGAAATRDEENGERTRNRGFNLSYRAELASSETLLAGRPFAGVFVAGSGKTAEISLETRFAERLGVGLGDTLGFDVLGVNVEGRIVNLRAVRWTSFQPNFFVQFQPGVLDDAPKTFVAAIARGSVVDAESGAVVRRKAALQGALVRKFPNVSIIDVDAAVRRLLAIVEQIAAAITFMAVATVAAALAVLFAIANHQARARQRDIALLKVLGAGFPLVRRMVLAEFACLGAGASALGGAIGLVASYVLATYIFKTRWQPALDVPLYVAASMTALATTTGLLAAARSLRARPISLLR
jgi:putative ABC transport system permease protein